MYFGCTCWYLDHLHLIVLLIMWYISRNCREWSIYLTIYVKFFSKDSYKSIFFSEILFFRQMHKCKHLEKYICIHSRLLTLTNSFTNWWVTFPLVMTRGCHEDYFKSKLCDLFISRLRDKSPWICVWC